ncbi:MAG: NAD(P)-dependent oxidoreductase [Desulfarculaceae bacterium]|jgi:3-hydroxyisobutyrate dehydrogenase
MQSVGFIGLGVMGGVMSKRLLEAGYKVIAYDIVEESLRTVVDAGAEKASSLDDVAKNADVIICMLPTPNATKEVFLGEKGLINMVRPGSILVDMSTSSPLLAREINEKFVNLGTEVLDAPVSGGIAGAKAGTLTIMVGGEEKTLDAVKPIMECLGGKIHYIGPAGSGHTMKLVNNMLFAVIMSATSEAMVLGIKAGLDPKVLREIINASSGRSYAMDIKVRDFVLPGNFEPGFAATLQIKDMDLALQMGKDLNTPLMMANLARQFYQAVLTADKGHKDTSIIYEIFEKFMNQLP